MKHFKTLDELCIAMAMSDIRLIDYDWTNLPKFSEVEYELDPQCWSYDAHRKIIGYDKESFEIVPISQRETVTGKLTSEEECDCQDCGCPRCYPDNEENRCLDTEICESCAEWIERDERDAANWEPHID